MNDYDDLKDDPFPVQTINFKSIYANNQKSQNTSPIKNKETLPLSKIDSTDSNQQPKEQFKMEDMKSGAL